MDGSGQEIGPLTSARVHTSVAIAVTDRAGGGTHWSSGAQSHLGHTSAEIIGRPVTGLFTAEGATPHRDERHLDSRVRRSPLLDADGEAAYLVTVDAGRASDAPSDDTLIRLMFEQHPAPHVVYNRDARVLHGNAMMLRATGATRTGDSTPPDHQGQGQRVIPAPKATRPNRALQRR